MNSLLPCEDLPALLPSRMTILVVDDEPLILDLLSRALTRFGFDVRQAGSGDQAVRLYERHRGTVDVVLLDVQMPGTDGPRTLTALQSIDPGVRCVFMSGNTGRYTIEQLLALGAACVLPKPFSSLDELTRMLREVARPRWRL